MIRFFEYVREAFDALMRNKTRSILTMLGIFIGVGAVDAVYALSRGATVAIDRSVSTGDQPALTIYPEPNQRNPAQAGITFRDAVLARDAGASSMRRVVPFYSIAYGNNARRYNVRKGTGAAKSVAFGYSWHGDDDAMQVVAGRAFSTPEVDAASNVCMLSPDLAFKLYGDYDAAVGRYVAIGGTRFKVVGVTDNDRGTASNVFFGSYYFVLPYSAFHNFSPGKADALLVWTTSPEDEGTATRIAVDTLKHAHGASSDYHVDSTRQQLEQQDKIFNIVGASLTSIGAISLLVAGIGIMNIMLVSVTERTREIGIRKSVGAKRADIVLQFLIEATLMALAGGGAGLLLAIGIILAASGSLSRLFGSFVIPYAVVVLLAFAFSLTVGVVFGVYPAIRASRLDPVEALRS